MKSEFIRLSRDKGVCMRGRALCGIWLQPHPFETRGPFDVELSYHGLLTRVSRVAHHALLITHYSLLAALTPAEINEDISHVISHTKRKRAAKHGDGN